MRVLDQLLDGLREACAAFPDKRKSEGVYTVTDIGLSGSVHRTDPDIR
jgi:hypothetical protein